jgi:CDGSH-type Zn-finger protein
MSETPEEQEVKRSIVEVKPNGPIVVHGPLEVRIGDEVTLRDRPVTSFCACGKSQNLPYCDGSHKPKPVE